MKRENILISEDFTTKRVSATKFTTGDIPVFDYSIHFGKEGNDVTMQNCNIKDNAIVKCSPDDTYDFETGALISLMKMCGVDKVVRACNEAFSEDTFKTYALKYERELNELKKENEKLQHEYDLCKNSENALKCSVDYLNKTIAKLNTAIYGYKEDLNKVTKRCTELEAKEDILNKQEETINKREEEMSVYFGGRGNGKQYKALVALFKKLDQKKVDAAYKEAYNTTLPVWQKEVLKQMYDIHHVNEWYYRIPTKREEMWENILGASKCPPIEIKVAKQEVTSFLRELQDKIPETRWNGSDCPPLEYTNPYWFKHDYIYFALFRNDDKGDLRMCYDDKPHSWISKPVIEYIAPMRWDLFKKGRIVVGVRKEQYDEFRKEITQQFGAINQSKPYDNFNYSFFIFDKNANFIEAIGRSQFRQIKELNNHKVYYWEDVRDKTTTMEDPYDTWSL